MVAVRSAHLNPSEQFELDKLDCSFKSRMPKRRINCFKVYRHCEELLKRA